MKSWKPPALAIVAVLAACATSPQHPAPRTPTVSDALASRAASQALAMVGKPYRYAGNTPAGFDCSGLVQYSYGYVGIDLPRDTQTLLYKAGLISTAELRRGDLLFFDEAGTKLSHVGIYLGHKRFVHAPSTSGKVRTDSLDADYWRKHFAQARRL